MTSTRGSTRCLLGFVLFLGGAGAANNGPLTVPVLLVLLGSALLCAWGALRMQHGPLLALGGRWWAGRPRGAARRRQALYLRAGGR